MQSLAGQRRSRAEGAFSMLPFFLDAAQTPNHLPKHSPAHPPTRRLPAHPLTLTAARHPPTRSARPPTRSPAAHHRSPTRSPATHPPGPPARPLPARPPARLATAARSPALLSLARSRSPAWADYIVPFAFQCPPGPHRLKPPPRRITPTQRHTTHHPHTTPARPPSIPPPVRLSMPPRPHRFKPPPRRPPLAAPFTSHAPSPRPRACGVGATPGAASGAASPSRERSQASYWAYTVGVCGGERWRPLAGERLAAPTAFSRRSVLIRAVLCYALSGARPAASASAASAAPRRARLPGAQSPVSRRADERSAKASSSAVLRQRAPVRACGGGESRSESSSWTRPAPLASNSPNAPRASTVSRPRPRTMRPRCPGPPSLLVLKQ
ncbi:Protein of unknown function [Gryllus bimaculatus]|nr:Protein of unknown function [Gryllus bimaculatus]